MTAHPSIDTRTARPAVWTLTLLLTALSFAGCYGGPSIDPQLEAQRRELSKQTIDTQAGTDEDRQARLSDAEVEGEDAAMDEETTPAPVDNPQPPGPAATPGDGGPPISDDSGRCGNGVLDDDELCEIGIPEGEEGACPSECGGDECNPERLEVRGCWTVCLPAAPDPELECP